MLRRKVEPSCVNCARKFGCGKAKNLTSKDEAICVLYTAIP